MGLLEHLSNIDLVDARRAIAVRAIGTEAKKLYDEGYTVDADRVLDELSEQLKRWPHEAP